MSNWVITEYHAGSVYGWSEIFEFTALAPRPDGGYEIAMFGDMGSENARSLGKLQRMTQFGDIDLVLHVGKQAFFYDFLVKFGEINCFQNYSTWFFQKNIFLHLVSKSTFLRRFCLRHVRRIRSSWRRIYASNRAHRCLCSLYGCRRKSWGTSINFEITICDSRTRTISLITWIASQCLNPNTISSTGTFSNY